MASTGTVGHPVSMEPGGQVVPARAVATILVNGRGELLLQLRDGNALVSPNQWGLVGGGLNPGEDPVVGTMRELREETGLVPDDELTLIHHGTWPASLGPGQTEWWVFAAATAATASDIEVHEGEDITFVPADRAANLELSVSATRFLLPFISSDEHRRLTHRAGELAGP